MKDVITKRRIHARDISGFVRQRWDLFAEGEQGIYVEDLSLLERLASEKLWRLAEDLQRNGWKMGRGVTGPA